MVSASASLSPGGVPRHRGRVLSWTAAGEAGDSEGPAKSFFKCHALVLEIALETCNAKPLVLETVLRNCREERRNYLKAIS